MAAIAAMALVVSLRKSRIELIAVRVGTAVAAGGTVGAPVGVWINKQLSPNLLLVLFAVLAAVIGLWTLFTGKSSETNGAQSLSLPLARSQSMLAQLTLMTLVGVIAGILSGMLGVGGGFFIIPPLLFFAGLEIHSAIATSLPVVVLISAVAMTGRWSTTVTWPYPSIRRRWSSGRRNWFETLRTAGSRKARTRLWSSSPRDSNADRSTKSPRGRALWRPPLQ
jgi:uncharacterized membrane protein YfcA